MDWATHDHRTSRPESGALVIVTRHWRLIGPSNRPLSCVTVRDVVGLEVRVGYSDLDLIRSERVASKEVGAVRAGEWKAAAIGLGSFTDLDAPN